MSILNLVGRWENEEGITGRLEFFDDGTYYAEGDFSSGSYKVYQGYVELKSSSETNTYLRFVNTASGIMLQLDMEIIPIRYKSIQGNWTTKTVSEATDVDVTDKQQMRYSIAAVRDILRYSDWHMDYEDTMLPNISFDGTTVTSKNDNDSSPKTYQYIIESATSDITKYTADIVINNSPCTAVIECIGDYGIHGYNLSIRNNEGMLIVHTKTDTIAPLMEP